MTNHFARLLAPLLLASPLSAAAPALLQPPSSTTGLVMEVGDGRATLLRPNGQRLRLPLHRGELIEELVEFDNGWAAAGVRIQRDRRDLVVVQDGVAGVERLDALPEPQGAYRVRPVPLAAANGLAGLAWLEGDSPDSYVVRVAAWTGAGWDLPETVSGPRRRGQAGLAGAVLEDGRWLLVWSASDGHGPEILWSARVEGRWTPPRRLGPPNLVPDVTPSLVPTGDGALLVWAQQHSAGYALRAARFTDRWSAPRRVGEVNAWQPRFAEIAEAGRFLLHRDATGWAALELDADGRQLRRAKFETERRQRPALTLAGGGPSLRWESSAAASRLVWEGAP